MTNETSPPPAKIVNWHITDPANSSFGNKNDRAVFKVARCRRSETCQAFAQGDCATYGMFTKNCPNAEFEYQQGFTPRARGYGAQVEGWREVVEGIDRRNHPTKVCQVHGFIYFPYAHWSLDKSVPCPEESRGGFFRSQMDFIPVDMFNAEWFDKVVKARPQAMMGGEIRDYQANIVPKMIADIRHVFPAFFKIWVEKFPESIKGIESVSYVGRAAFLHSMKPFEWKDDKGTRFVWDGEVVHVHDYTFGLFGPVKGTGKIVQIIPDKNETVKITSEDQYHEGLLLK